MSAPEARLVHAIPGRARLRLPERRGDALFFEEVAKRLEALPGVLQVSANPQTASLLLAHRGELSELLAQAARASLFRIGEPTGGPRAKPPDLAGLGRLLERWLDQEPGLRRARESGLDPRKTVVLFLTGLGLLQIARGQVLPAGATLLSNALNLLLSQPGASTDPERGADAGPDAGSDD